MNLLCCSEQNKQADEAPPKTVEKLILQRKKLVTGKNWIKSLQCLIKWAKIKQIHMH